MANMPSQEDGEYMEEETTSVLLIDDEFCQSMAALIHQAVASAIEPLERRLLQLTYTCPVHLSLSLDPLNKSTLGLDHQAHRPPKCKLETVVDLAVFDRLKKAFLECSSQVGADQDALGNHNFTPAAFPSADGDDEDSIVKYANEAGPSKLGDPRL
ncbi:hypothetical protein NDU88_005527 [Pleurodeles waltl]|uniref:Uncharacterized protein n=1 Tax=Pleurodeles waltl TaxID=8319 RepID=A0AAV7L1G5_PLEWA|nr:hypothetical protein NDU88_005527 [Pleurodeles waltl]